LIPAFIGKRLWFPDPVQADDEGLVAVGGDLSIERLLLAYRSGIFPWFIHGSTGTV
jgi:leucyl/phenylalanyl-tRNA--protein transferase